MTGISEKTEDVYIFVIKSKAMVASFLVKIYIEELVCLLLAKDLSA